LGQLIRIYLELNLEHEVSDIPEARITSVLSDVFLLLVQWLSPLCATVTGTMKRATTTDTLVIT